MDILNSLSQAILPGHRVRRVKGWEGLKAFAMPRDSEDMFLDEDDSKNYLYMKKVGLNGEEVCARYSFVEDPVEEFDPDKYVTKNDMATMKKELKEEILDGIDSKFERLVSAVRSGAVWDGPDGSCESCRIPDEPAAK